MDDDEARQRLQRNRKYLVDNLNIDDIIDEMVSNDLLSHDQEEEIVATSRNREKVRVALRFVAQKGICGYEKFLLCLEHVSGVDYSHVIAQLEKCEDLKAESESKVSESEIGLSQLKLEDDGQNVNLVGYDLVQPIIRVYCNDNGVMKNWKKIGRALELDESHITIIKSDNTNDLKEQTYQMLIKWIEIDGENATLPVLMKALRKSGCNHVADKIQKKQNLKGKLK